MYPSFVAGFGAAAVAAYVAASFHIRTSRDMNVAAAGPPLLQGRPGRRQGAGRRGPRARQAGKDGTALWMISLLLTLVVLVSPVLSAPFMSATAPLHVRLVRFLVSCSHSFFRNVFAAPV